MIWIVIGIIPLVLFIADTITDWIKYNKKKAEYNEKVKDWEKEVKFLQKEFDNADQKDREKYRCLYWRLDTLKQNKPKFYIRTEDKPFGAGMITLCTVCFILLGIIIWYFGCYFTGWALYCNKANTEEYYTSWNITAMQDNLNTHGRFYLRSGYIETDLCYYYFYPTKEGLKHGYVPANKTYLNYTDGTPHIERYSRKWNKTWIEFFTFVEAQCYDENIYYKAYIPEGTVEQSFNIDLQ